MAAQAYLYGGLAALQLAGGYFASENIKQTAKLNQQIANLNAEFAELDAYDSELEGLTASTRYQSVIDQTLGEQQASLAAADVDTSFGSASTIAEETKFIGQLNKMEIEKRAQEQALGYKRQARDIRLGSAMDMGEAKTRAAQARLGGITGAVESGLTGYQRSR